MQTPPLNFIEISGSIRAWHKILQNSDKELTKLEKFFEVKGVFEESNSMFENVISISNETTQEYYCMMKHFWKEYGLLKTTFLFQRFINSDDALSCLRLDLLNI